MQSNHFGGEALGKSVIALEVADEDSHFSRNDFLIVVGAESRLRAQIYSVASGVIPGSSAWSQFLQLCHWNCQVSIRIARCRGNSFHEGALTITSCLHTPGGITVKFRGEIWVDFASPYICFTSLLPFCSGKSLRTLIEASGPSFYNMEFDTCSPLPAICLGRPWSLPSVIQMESYGGSTSIITTPVVLM